MHPYHDDGSALPKHVRHANKCASCRLSTVACFVTSLVYWYLIHLRYFFLTDTTDQNLVKSMEITSFFPLCCHYPLFLQSLPQCHHIPPISTLCVVVATLWPSDYNACMMVSGAAALLPLLSPLFVPLKYKKKNQKQNDNRRWWRRAGGEGGRRRFE